MEAVILAGGPCEWFSPPLRAKGLVPIDDTPVGLRVRMAVEKTKHIDHNVLVIPLGEIWETGTVRPPGERFIDSLDSGLEGLRGKDRHQPVLVICGDLPFVTAVAIDNFIERCQARPDADVWYGYIGKKQYEALYPGIRRTKVRLKEGVFSGSSISLFRPSVFETIRSCIDELNVIRKSPFALVAKLGFWNIVLFVLGQLRLARIESVMSRLTTVRCVGIETPYPELGFDIDNFERYEYAQRFVRQVVSGAR